MRKKFFKGLDVLGKTLNLSVLGLFMWGSATYAPDSSATIFIWFVGISVLLYFVFEIICKISNECTNRDIQRYIESGFDPRSIK